MAHRFYDRLLEHELLQSLQAFPVVYIAGPRQSGKTTLVQKIIEKLHPAQYITFDDIQMRSAAQHDPTAFLNAFQGPVVLDEIQLVPELFRPLKIKVDENRKSADGGRGRFLLTGSASIMALPALSDALVGRMVLHTLYPFSAFELNTTSSNKTCFIDKAFMDDWKFEQRLSADSNKLMMNASFPELLQIHTADLRARWCNGYIDTILQRDIRSLMQIEKVESIPNLLKLMAMRAGSLLNETSLSRDTGLTQITARKYRLLLEGLFLTQSIPAWSSNLGKRLIKSPKIYLGDLNLLAYLMNTDIKSLITEKGQILENFLAIELNKQLTFSKISGKLYHYRSASGQEIDFILEGPHGHIVGIEVKSKTKVVARDFMHLEALQQEQGSLFKRGFVFYLGNEIVPFGKDLWAVPVQCLGV